MHPKVPKDHENTVARKRDEKQQMRAFQSAGWLVQLMSNATCDPCLLNEVSGQGNAQCFVSEWRAPPNAHKRLGYDMHHAPSGARGRPCLSTRPLSHGRLVWLWPCVRKRGECWCLPCIGPAALLQERSAKRLGWTTAQTSSEWDGSSKSDC